ncbi:alpha-glucan family phosphorylase [Methanotorris formicicus]|uniref:Alpha-glucan phosphorylase n=1 Tax=Methanotorris formicicus Mc-S-70 TaxID=647171 RepID=H1KZ75_9EURY|nr:alpha-glucan family phosphorylase [Methanotorris formicicus]EHP86358.1 alpha-glucan phosphorylase [Methanotorris formicicus Mc-S-70]
MKSTAYFCMEFAIDQPLKTYAGGLGFLAGSHFRTAKRLNMPLVGVSILWSYGYYDQVRDMEGRMKVEYVRKYYDFLTDIDLKVPVTINGATVWVKVYKLEEDVFGTCPIYFLTTDIPENDYLSRTISHHLYDSNNLTHIAQEIVLGIGGYKVIKECENVKLFHLNEPHGLPLAFKMLEDYGLDYVREHLVFTTHTPMPEGNETQDVNLLKNMGFFGNVDIKIAEKLGGNPFNLTVAALRMSKRANAVSKQHKKTVEQMWSWVKDKCEIISITNAQDRYYWQDKIIKESAENYDYDKLRERKMELKKMLFEEVADQTGKIFDPNIMTVVWARRFVEYKRPYLPLYDEKRLRKLLESNKMQIIWAGKPHPNDSQGQMTFNWIVSKTREMKNAAILTGYELKLSKLLKMGSDIWLNTPRKPCEASGTSGMTASMNGSIHMSTLDGWHVEWVEMYPDDSFTIGDGININDAYEADCMYRELEKASKMYDTDAWWEKVANCVNHIVEYFDAERMVKEYAEKIYK